VSSPLNGYIRNPDNEGACPLINTQKTKRRKKTKKQKDKRKRSKITRRENLRVVTAECLYHFCPSPLNASIRGPKGFKTMDKRLKKTASLTVDDHQTSG